MDDVLRARLRHVPAGVRLHHAYVGGLLEHVVTMMDAADRLLPLYPSVDRDLVLIGVFLHDAGKVRELTYRRPSATRTRANWSVTSRSAVEMLNEQPEGARADRRAVPAEAGAPAETHDPEPSRVADYGSPKVPMTPEAMLLHCIDLLDTRMFQVKRELKEDRNTATAWTPRTGLSAGL